MTYTVTANCEKCKYTDCVEVCPVEAFHEGPDMLYINPETCIDCFNACYRRQLIKNTANYFFIL